jgi:hypothetical protein
MKLPNNVSDAHKVTELKEHAKQNLKFKDTYVPA